MYWLMVGTLVGTSPSVAVFWSLIHLACTSSCVLP
jgi:hypothetical protein